jgi:hypothetical protein
MELTDIFVAVAHPENDAPNRDRTTSNAARSLAELIFLAVSRRAA